MEEMSLPALFEQARKIHAMASESSVVQEKLKRGIEALRRCDEMVSKLGLFSSNETKDDVSTTNLKYLLIPFYLGELTEKIAQEERIDILKISQFQLKEFLSICEALELLPEEEIERSMQRGPEDFAALRAKKPSGWPYWASWASSLGLVGLCPRFQPVDKRSKILLKIARFKHQKAAEAKLQELKERKERRERSLRASAVSTPIGAGEEDLQDDDGEEEREAYDFLDMLKKEEDMLVAVKERGSRIQNLSQEGNNEFAREVLDERTKRAEMWHRNAANQAPFAKPTQLITCATFAQDVIEGRAKASQAHEHKHQPLIFGPASLIGGKLTSEREMKAAQVFQPGYRAHVFFIKQLPTMSIEEAGLREMEIMNEWQERNARLMEEANSSWYEDNNARPGNKDESDDDAAQEKARAWDDWKDDNPCGAGNKKLTPCGIRKR
ncbi:PP2A regulatory subunit TAP46 [Apostasia shenzhenica]|uniref:PP2A regulatory subunit TAP46 n=1 Tax=Apostasia shenzhenica TaxID=1088818 RepID=A0A2I0ANX1_9ASPA|nr:PP2A regulatory subunit TAP46 [Apostasia shenzhenica]